MNKSNADLFDVLLDNLADPIAEGFTKEKADALCQDLAKYGIGAKPFPAPPQRLQAICEENDFPK